ncbi:MAG: hypothetical protein ACFFBD_03665 [Candidatus Hodarchaeota archaeon]
MCLDQRQFILLMRNIPSFEAIKNLQLNNLTAYRIDALLRSINAAFFLSNDFRGDTCLSVCLGDNTVIKFSGKKLRGLNPDERQLAGVLRKATLQKKYPGIKFQREGLENLELGSLNTAVLEQSSKIIKHEDLKTLNQFILGGYQGFLKEDLEYLKKLNIPSLSLGEKTYLSSHCIVFIHMVKDEQLNAGRNNTKIKN